MSQRVCVLTGSGGMLGNAFCRLYGERYRIVALWCRRLPQVASQEQRIIDPFNSALDLPENRHPVHTLRVDLTKRNWTARVVQEIIDRFGHIDVVVSAAAVRDWGPLLEGDAFRASLQRHFAVNVIAPVSLALEIAQSAWVGKPQENRDENRNLVHVSSTAGLHAYTGHGQSAYSASKAALNLVTQHMAAEFQPLGIRVNAIAPNTFPGIVSTEHVLERIVSLAEGTQTGQILVVDSDGDSWHA